MRVLVVAGPGPGVGAVTEQVASGWSARAPHDDVVATPLSDGGLGFLEAVRAHHGGLPTPVLVTGPQGEDVPAEFLVSAGHTAYIDAALAAGLQLTDPQSFGDLADLTTMSSRGVGELLVQAREAGAERIVVGVGDLASHDGGVGLLQALGAGEDLQRLPEVRRDWAAVSLVLAAASDLPLLGFHGASAALGSERGLGPMLTQGFERVLAEVADRVNRVLPPPRDLLTGRPRQPEREPSAGVGGGVGFALQLLGANTVSGAAFLLDELGVTTQMTGSLVVVATEAYDWRSVGQGVVAEAARAALEVGAPTVVLAQRVDVGRREGMSLGISGSYAARPGESWQELAARVARTWSPPPQS